MLTIPTILLPSFPRNKYPIKLTQSWKKYLSAAKSGKSFHGKTLSKTLPLIKSLFEHKNIKKITGTNLALLFLAVSVLPNNKINLTSYDNDVTFVPIVLTTEKNAQFPLSQFTVTRGYLFYHPAIDFDAKTGDPIYPIKKGFVSKISHSRFGYGNAVEIDHGNNLTSLYAHLSKIEVTENQQVTKQTVIWKVGSTGFASGDHLHLEIREKGYPINPSSVLPVQ